jgi:hypothetical protein
MCCLERNLVEELTLAAKRFREASPEDRQLYVLAVDRLLDEYGVIDPSKPVPMSSEVAKQAQLQPKWHGDGRGSE